MNELAKLGSLYPGSRIGVLLIHGLSGTPTELSLLAKDLNHYGFTVLCPLLAGHCQSEAELLKTGWQDCYESVDNAYRSFSQYMDTIFVGGISAGAVLSLHLAQNRPGQLRGLGLYSITLRWDGWTIPKLSFLLPVVLRLPVIGKRYRFEESYPYGIKNERIREKIYAKMMSGDSSTAGFSGIPGRSLLDLWQLVDVVKVGLPELATPALLVHARDDDIATIRNALYIKEHIGGPSRLVALEESYHMITIDQERKKVSLESARWFYEHLTAVEKTELSLKAKNHAMIEDLATTCNFQEKLPAELLHGLSKRRYWFKSGSAPSSARGIPF